MQLSIVIVNWNTRQLLVNCLESIYSSPPEGVFDIWVVDNSSSDGSSAKVRQNFPEVKLIENNENVGFGRANNQAIEESRSQYLLILNPDTVVKSRAVSGLVNFLDQNPDVGIAGPKLINPDGTLQISAFPFPTLSKEFWRVFHLDKLTVRSSYPMEKWNQNQVKEVDYLSGACMLIRRSALNQIGVFDENFFIYSEEVDLCLRFKEAGWSLYWVPTTSVIHYGGRSTQQVSEDMFLKLYESKVMYFRKHHSSFTVQVYKLILFAGVIVKLMLTPLVLFAHPAQRDEHLALSNNYRHLLSTLPGL
jgi:GT2 family glycosyltransferase